MSKHDLVAFISIQRTRFVNHDNNVFAFAFSQVERYRRFLIEIVSRHAASAKRYVVCLTSYMDRVSDKNGPMSPEDITLWSEVNLRGEELQLEIESFFQFAKILLDRLAQAIQVYFGRAHGISFITHHKLTAQFSGYAKQKRLEATESVLHQAILLQSMISDFRDRHITHGNNPRTIKFLSVDAEYRVSMGITEIYPGGRPDQIDSLDVEKLNNSIVKYIESVIVLILRNEARTGLQLLE